MSGFNVQLQLAGVLEWMSQQMAGCGGKTAVVGISGGKDSSTVAAMAVAAYGRDHVYGVLMPDGIQPDIDYSQALVEHLQIPHCTCNIHDAVAGVLSQLEQAGLTPGRQPVVKLPARCRRATRYAVGRYTTEEVIALGRARGLPERFLIKPPSDGLTGLTDEDNLGFSYHAVNEYIRRGVCPDEAVREKIDRMHRASRFKFQTLPVYHNGLPMVIEDGTDYYK